jgi:hypothetical protein
MLYCSLGLHSSGMLFSISVQPLSPIFKGQAVQEDAAVFFFTACCIHVNYYYTIVLCTAVTSKLVDVIEDKKNR